MAPGFTSSRFVRGVNYVATALMDAPLIGRLVRRGWVTIQYVGRRSGQTFSTPVAYRRTGDSIVIPVGMPDSKNWWKNFQGEGGPVTLVGLDGADRTAHAVAHRNPRGRVSVTAKLDPS